MLLQNPLALEKRCRRLWSLAAAVGLFGLGVLAAGLGLSADASSPPAAGVLAQAPDEEPIKKDRPRPEPKPGDPRPDPDRRPPQPGDDPRPDVDRRPPGHGPARGALEALRKMLEELKNTGADPKDLEQLRKMLEQVRVELRVPGRTGEPMFDFFIGHPGDGRLGITVEKPSATLLDQLGLKTGDGLVISEVRPDSPAAKAGLKVNDILLEVDGKAISADVRNLAKVIGEVKAETPVDAVVLRKGKKETVKGLSLPEARGNVGRGFLGREIRVPLPPNFGLPPAAPFGPGANQVMTTLFRNEDRFTLRHQEGSLVITLTGKTAEGKAKVDSVHVQDGRVNDDYDTVDKVPDRYRDKVKNLMELAEKGSGKIEIRTPREDRKPEERKRSPEEPRRTPGD